jgi:endonuclease/exonuclease/phosphatase family metal-dependent hydrolase
VLISDGAVQTCLAGVVRLLTWNIHHGADARGQLDLEAVGRVVEEADADVVALQEVDRRWGARSGGVDQPAWLADRLRMHVRFTANVRRRRLLRRTGDYGLALLSRTPMSGVEPGRFAPVRGQERRGYLMARVDCDGEPVTVCCTHLGASAGAGGEAQRVAQARELLTRLPPWPVAVAGDFNAVDDAASTRLLAGTLLDSFAVAGAGPGTTIGSGRGAQRIDRVWVRGLRAVEARVLDTDASDHRPLLVTLHR